MSSESAPELFRCERRSMSLSRPSCARLWLSAQQRRPEPWEGRAACRVCPIGAANAGRPMAETAAMVEELGPICPRCTRSATRLIHGRLCVSCYNRAREALKGRNAKGGTPRLCAKLHTQVLAVGDAGAVRVERLGSVVSRVEAMISLAKQAKGPISFGVPSPALPVPLGYQRELGL